MSHQNQLKSLVATPISNSASNSQQKVKEKKRLKGNSQFIRSKFDIDYSPKLRIFNISKTPQNTENILKREKQKHKTQQISTLIRRTQEELKSGKKIIIDWSQKNSFRTTRFPSLGQSFTGKRCHTQQNIGQLQKSRNKKIKLSFLSNMSSSSPNKQITNKSEYLRQLIAQSIRDKKHKKAKLFKIPKSRSYLKQKQDEKEHHQQSLISLINNSTTSIDPHFNVAIVQEVDKKQKQFFKKNKHQILQAINYQLQMGQSLKHENDKKVKNKLQEIHQRIICKSKLTLLKSDLARKFKQIRDVFQQSSQVVYSPKQLS